MCNLQFHSQTKLSLYADDTVIFNNTVDLSQVQNNLQKDFDLIVTWMGNNDMFINSGKTKTMVFGPKRKLQNAKFEIVYKNLTIEYF